MTHQTLIMYSHDTCTLCDKLKLRIQPLLEKHNLTIQSINIKKDRELLRAYRYRIPVLNYQDQTLLEGNPSDEQIQQAFKRFD